MDVVVPPQIKGDDRVKAVGEVVHLRVKVFELTREVQARTGLLVMSLLMNALLLLMMVLRAGGKI